MMKKSICFVLAIGLLMLSGCGSAEKAATDSHQYIEYAATKNDITLSDMQTAAENESLVLRMDNNTTDFEIEVKKTGYIWRSTGGMDKEGTGSPVAFTYLDASGAVATMNAMNDSVKKGQYKIKKIDNGVSVTYSFGDIVNDLIYPSYISAERFESFTDKMSSYNKAVISSLYLHLDEDLYGEDVYADYLRTYPKAQGKNVYLLRNSDMLLNAKKQLAAAFSDAGYTKEDLESDCKEFGISSTVSASTSYQFNLEIQYVLDGDNLVVELPADQRFCSGNSSGIETLSVMQYFGSPAADDEGYFMLPDGSGSIMNFYKGTEAAGRTVNIPMYGKNYSITENESIYSLNQAIMPVYGVKNGRNAYFAVIEDGDAIASVNAISGTDTLSARVWPDFSILDTQAVYPKSLSDTSYYEKSAYTKEQKQPYGGDLRLRYHFLTQEDANYSGMAVWYGNYLFGDRKLTENTLPLYTEAVSAIDYEKSNAGFTYKVIKTLTDFNQAGEIALDLQSCGVQREKLILSGWQKNGWRSAYTDKDKISSDAGGEKGFKQLSTLLKDSQIEFFPESEVQFVYQSALKSGIDKKLVSRTLVQQLSKKYAYNLSDYQKSDMLAYAMRPDYVVKSLTNAVGNAKKYDTTGISLRNLTRYFIPDYDEDNVTDREETKDVLVSEARKQCGAIKLLSRTGNVPFATLMSDVVELPLHSTGNNNCAYEIPFAAMVYSGRIEYAAGAVNLSGMQQRDILKMIESNAAVYCLITAQSDDNIKQSSFNEWYSICYDDLKDGILSCYNQVKEAGEGNYGCRITAHERLSDNVYKSTFENGNYVIVNYNNYDVNIKGVTVKATDYLRGES